MCVCVQALGHKENGEDDSSDDESSAPAEAVTLSQSPPPFPVVANGHATPTPNETTSDRGVPESGQAGELSNGDSSQLLETEKKVESSMDLEGKVEVVTSVKVQTANGVDEEGEGERKEGEGEKEGEGMEGEKKRRTSTEVAIAEASSALTVTLIRDNTVEVTDSTDSDSSDVEGTLPTLLVD